MIDLIKAYNENTGGRGSKKIANVGFANIKKLQQIIKRPFEKNIVEVFTNDMVRIANKVLTEIAEEYIGTPDNIHTRAQMLRRMREAVADIHPDIEVVALEDNTPGACTFEARMTYPPDSKVSGTLQIDKEEKRDTATVIDLIAEYNKMHKPVESYPLPKVIVSRSERLLSESSDALSEFHRITSERIAAEMDRQLIRAIESLAEDDEGEVNYIRLYSEEEMRGQAFRLNTSDYTGAFNLEVRHETEPLYSMGNPIMHINTGRSTTVYARDVYGLKTFLSYSADRARIYLFNPIARESSSISLQMGRDGNLYEYVGANMYRRMNEERLGLMLAGDIIMATVQELTHDQLLFNRTPFSNLSNFNVN